MASLKHNEMILTVVSN